MPEAEKFHTRKMRVSHSQDASVGGKTLTIIAELKLRRSEIIIETKKEDYI
jgi:hypothetical protein